MLQSMGSQRVRQDLETKHQQMADCCTYFDVLILQILWRSFCDKGGRRDKRQDKSWKN